MKVNLCFVYLFKLGKRRGGRYLLIKTTPTIKLHPSNYRKNKQPIPLYSGKSMTEAYKQASLQSGVFRF